MAPKEVEAEHLRKDQGGQVDEAEIEQADLPVEEVEAEAEQAKLFVERGFEVVIVGQEEHWFAEAYTFLAQIRVLASRSLVALQRSLMSMLSALVL